MIHLSEIQSFFSSLPVEEAIGKVAELFPGRVKFSTSLGQEDQVLTDMIGRHHLPVSIFTLDTGRLFNESYETLEKTRARYRLPIDVYFPLTDTVQKMVTAHGVNLFYDSVENRQMCCGVRKVEPLNRALKNTSVWITGLRASQTDHRRNTGVAEWMPDKEMYKLNPLINWSYEDVLAYIEKYSVPFNPLHNHGFISIGCAPCTRSVLPDEDPRAGRWWWETSHKECGLHLVK